MFDRQFDLMGRLLDLGLDVYAYATFTSPPRPGAEVHRAMRRFVDRLQELDENLPLRTVPLEIKVFTPVERRLGTGQAAGLAGQVPAIEAWQEELARRYPGHRQSASVADVPLHGRR
jgi:hypothetical protein